MLAVLGPTASGKSALGLALAERYGGEIINCDSTAVYRGFDIGTDKLPVEDRRGIPHHLIDIADPDRGVHRRAVRPRRRGGDSRDSWPRQGFRFSSAEPASTTAR